VLILFGVALLALLLFVGLAIDTGSLYITYGQLKRAVDASAVSAANDFKRGASIERMTQDAIETLNLHNVPTDEITLNLYVCDSDADGVRDPELETSQPEFYSRCPDTTSPANESPRKLVWIDAVEQAPLYFLQLIGVNAVSLRTNAIAEAAPVDVVIVLDVSESMGKDTTSPSPYVVDDYNPNSASIGCNPVSTSGDPRNPSGTCQPLGQAKTAAKALIDTLYDGYDRVAIVTFDQLAYVHTIRNKANTADMSISDNLTDAQSKIDAVQLHDDPPFARVWQAWATNRAYNPVNLEDRDGNGADLDALGFTCPTFETSPGVPRASLVDRWWSTSEGAPDPYGWGGVPCDDGTKNDAINWNTTNIYTSTDTDISNTWMSENDPDGAGELSVFLSPLSTCSGCGIRVASDILTTFGRPGAVWVVVFLSDGVTNLSDRPGTGGSVPSAYPNGFCTGGLGSYNWTHGCIPAAASTRHCIDSTSATCPPSTSWDGSNPSPSYNVLDYAMDMADTMALTKSTNLGEPAGNDIAIYSIGLGSAVAGGEKLLRYMAAVGDDGDRETDPCRSVASMTSCGQYYYAPQGNALLPIFEDIATRIYTRITD
jgi:pyrimidine operon attenuation protein/uracil phosphoribosyltransferase